MMTKLNAGESSTRPPPKFPGSHGVGVSCVNALSEELELANLGATGLPEEQTYSAAKTTASEEGRALQGQDRDQGSLH